MTAEPLSGWRVLIGRTAGRSAALLRLLAAEGAQAQAVPLIDIVPAADSAGLDAVLLTMAAGDCEWAAFTSVNAVNAVVIRAAQLHLLPVVSAQTRVAAVGPATALALRTAGIAVDLVPASGGSTADLLAAFPAARTGETVVLPRSDIGAGTLPDALRRMGYQVHAAVAYRTVSRPLPPSIAEDLAGAGYQAVVVTSPSAVPALMAAVPADGVATIAIGLPTARALAAAGRPPTEIATGPTDHEIVAAVIRCAGASSAARRQQGESTP